MSLCKKYIRHWIQIRYPFFEANVAPYPMLRTADTIAKVPPGPPPQLLKPAIATNE